MDYIFLLASALYWQLHWPGEDLDDPARLVVSMLCDPRLHALSYKRTRDKRRKCIQKDGKHCGRFVHETNPILDINSRGS